MGNLLRGFIILLFTTATTAAYLVILLTLLPNLTNRVQRALETMPGRSFVVGLVNWTFFAIVAALIGAIAGRLPEPLKGLMGLFALAIVVALLALSTVGLAALVNLLRGRLSPTAPTPISSLWTAVLFLAATLAPILGWFILAPVALSAGLGAAVMALVLRPQPPAKAADL